MKCFICEHLPPRPDFRGLLATKEPDLIKRHGEQLNELLACNCTSAEILRDSSLQANNVAELVKAVGLSRHLSRPENKKSAGFTTC